MLAAACAGQGSTTAPPGPSSPAASNAPVPAFAGPLRTTLTAQLGQLRTPGALVLVDAPGKGTWQAGLGVGNIVTNTPLTTDDHMRIGSITKTFTATVILQLVDEHRLGLDDPVAKYIPQVPNGAHITIRELLNMTSGIFNTTEDDGLNQSLDKEPRKVWTDAELFAVAFGHPPYFPPGTGFHYSNTNYDMLGAIATQLGGAPLPDLMRTRIFDKLGMTQTSLPPRDTVAIPDPHQRGYDFATNVQGNVAYQAVLAHDVAGAQITAPPGAKPMDTTDSSLSYSYASGAAISTLHDLQIWAKALGTGVLLSPATQRERLQFGAYKYGLGIDHNLDGFIGHNGAVPGFQSILGYEPTTGAIVIVLCNLQIAPNLFYGKALPADALAGSILQQVFPGK